MNRISDAILAALKAADGIMVAALIGAMGTLFLSSLACRPPVEPESPLEEQDSLAVLAVLKANHLKWQAGDGFVERDSLGRATVLRLHDLGLDTLPPEIGDLTHLVRMDLGGNRLHSLPREFEALTALEILDLSRNRFDSLPDGFTLARLRELRLSDNRLTGLPRNVDVTSLQDLDLDRNLIAVLPPDFRYLRALASFSMRDNRLDSLPPTFNPENHPALRRLELYGNRLADLPGGMPAFAFDYLDLGGNRLCLPESAAADSSQAALIAWLDASDRDWRATQACP